MIAMLVQFDVSGSPEAIDRSNPSESYPRYKQVPGLVSKAYINSRARKMVGGFYVWEDRAAMERYLNGGGLANAEKKFGVKPTIETFEVAGLMNGMAALAAA